MIENITESVVMKKNKGCEPVSGDLPACEIAPEPDNEYTRAINEAAKKIHAICDEFNKKYDPLKLYLYTEDETYPNLSPDEKPQRTYRISADVTSYF